jgi:hypothetical protein
MQKPSVGQGLYQSLLLVIPASMTGAYSSLDVLQGLNPPRQLLKALVYHSATSAGTYMVCKDGRMIIPKPLQRRAVLWYHHYLQHPGHTQLEETMNATMVYWKGMCSTIRSITKSCRSCQVNKKQKLKYRHLPSKTVIAIPWRALCVDLIGP